MRLGTASIPVISPPRRWPVDETDIAPLSRGSGRPGYRNAAGHPAAPEGVAGLRGGAGRPGPGHSITTPSVAPSAPTGPTAPRSDQPGTACERQRSEARRGCIIGPRCAAPRPRPVHRACAAAPTLLMQSVVLLPRRRRGRRAINRIQYIGTQVADGAGRPGPQEAAGWSALPALPALPRPAKLSPRPNSELGAGAGAGWGWLGPEEAARGEKEGKSYRSAWPSMIHRAEALDWSGEGTALGTAR